MYRFGYAVFENKEIAKTLIKKGSITVKAGDKGKGEIIIVDVKEFPE